MEKKKKTSEKIQKLLVNLIKILVLLIIVVLIINYFLGRHIAKQKEQQANAKLPVIEERIKAVINDNVDINYIKPYFEYEGINFIELYVEDTWFNSSDIEKIRFAADVRDFMKTILVEESFIKPSKIVGIYVYTVDGILLAESNMYGEIKLKD